MNDILQALRDKANVVANRRRALYEEAADEIERLREALRFIVSIENSPVGDDYGEIELARQVACNALLGLESARYVACRLSEVAMQKHV